MVTAHSVATNAARQFRMHAQTKNLSGSAPAVKAIVILLVAVEASYSGWVSVYMPTPMHACISKPHFDACTTTLGNCFALSLSY